MYDPVLDILKVFPSAVGNTLATLERMWEGREDFEEACMMAHKIQTLLEAVLQEDQNDIDRTLNEFLEHWNTVPAYFRYSFMEVLFVHLVTFIGVAERRAESNKKPIIPAPEETMETSMLAYLQDKTAKQVKKELRGPFFAAFNNLTPGDPGAVTIECAGEVMEDAKKLVADMIPVARGPQKWETIAQIIRSKAEAGTRKGEMLKSVYPSYEED